MPTKKATPSWVDVKAKLVGTDRAALLTLVQDLYAASKDNQAFLHARLQLGDDLLKPYKTTIARWLWPDVFKNQDTSVAKAKKAIADHRKASGAADGQAELMVFYCEQGAGFSRGVGMDDESYFNALVRMYDQALNTIASLPEAQRQALWERLDEVRAKSQDVGYGVGEEMDRLFAHHAPGD